MDIYLFYDKVDAWPGNVKSCVRSRKPEAQSHQITKRFTTFTHQGKEIAPQDLPLAHMFINVRLD